MGGSLSDLPHITRARNLRLFIRWSIAVSPLLLTELRNFKGSLEARAKRARLPMSYPTRTQLQKQKEQVSELDAAAVELGKMIGFAEGRT